jgi:plastocyanin
MNRPSIVSSILSSVMLFAFANGHGAELTISIADARGRAVPDAVVIATALGAEREAWPRMPVVMDQVNKAFVPAVLVVRTGTPVIFPNSDTIAHQVYSFSPAKRFELGLYRGHPHSPIVLDRPGLIVLGCNIHDNMVGYIVVTDSPYFGKSDERGQLRLTSLPAADYDVTIWSPRLPRDADMAKRHITLSDATPGRTEIRFLQALAPPASAGQDARIHDY